MPIIIAGQEDIGILNTLDVNLLSPKDKLYTKLLSINIFVKNIGIKILGSRLYKNKFILVFIVLDIKLELYNM